jgi:hypothetical protein
MKTTLSIIFVICSILAHSQQVSYSELGPDKKGDHQSYVSKNGDTYKVGDKIKIGYPSSNKTFAFIWQGDGLLVPLERASVNISGNEVEIKRINVSGTKRAGYTVYLKTKGHVGIVNYTIQFENALETGEVESYGLSSDQALNQLKKAKDKLDLELITQQEYDSLKSVYSKFIK